MRRLLDDAAERLERLGDLVVALAQDALQLAGVRLVVLGEEGERAA